MTGQVIPFPSHRRDSEPWLLKRELAGELRVSERWIELRMRDGLPYLRMGRSPRFRLSEVEAWLRARPA